MVPNAIYKQAGRVIIKLTAQERQAWHRAAVNARLPLSDWIRQAVNLNLEPWHEYRYKGEGDSGLSQKDT